MSLQAQELMMNLDAVYHAIEDGEDKDSTKSKALSVFGSWARGTYGSRPDTDMYIICPRTTDGTNTLEGNCSRLMDFFTSLGEAPQGIMVLKATLEYVRKGMPINLEPFTPPLPSDKNTTYIFDKDTACEQQCILKNIYDSRGRLICAISALNMGAVLPRNAFASQLADHTRFNQRCLGDFYRGTITEVYALRAVVLIPKDRLRRALHFEIRDAISNLKRTGQSTMEGTEWELPICLKHFPIETDCAHLLEILDVSVTQGNFKIWEEVMEILCRFKTVKEIGESRVFASIKKFSFKKIQPFLDVLITRFTAVNDVSSFVAGVKESSSSQDQEDARKWCADRCDHKIMKILGSHEKTLPSLVQYGFVKGLPLLSGFIKSLSEEKTVGFTFWLSLVSQLDLRWKSINSTSFTGAPVRELHLMLDCCITAMTPLVSEGVVYIKAPPDLMEDVRHNARVHVKRTLIVVEISLRFSPARCGEVLSNIFLIPGDVQIKFDLFLGPLARGLRSLLGQYELSIFQHPFFIFYRFLVGMYLGFCLGNISTRMGGQSLARILCTKKVVCDRCELMEEFLSSGEESKEFYVTNREWKHLRYVFDKLKQRIFPPTVTSGELWKGIRVVKRPKQAGMDTAKEFLRTIVGEEEEISKLMEPFNEEVRRTLDEGEAFDFNLCLQLPPPFGTHSST